MYRMKCRENHLTSICRPRFKSDLAGAGVAADRVVAVGVDPAVGPARHCGQFDHQTNDYW